MKRKNNQPKYSADCFLDSDNLNFFYIINVLLFHLFNLKRHVGKSVVMVYALCGEAVDAVVGIIHAFRVVHFKSVAPEHCFCVVVSTDFDRAGEKRALVFVLCIVNVVHACFGIRPELSDSPCDDVFDKSVGANGPCEIRNDDAYARRHNLQV